MSYRIADLQIPGRYFCDGILFKTKEEVRLQLVDYHSIDSSDSKRLKKMTLDEVLEYGDWKLEEVREKHVCPFSVCIITMEQRNKDELCEFAIKDDCGEPDCGYG